MNEIARYVSFSKNDEFFIKDRELFINIFKKKISSLDRINLVKRMSELDDFVLHTNSDCSNLKGVKNSGIVDYLTEMPIMFNRSKININVTLRNI